MYFCILKNKVMKTDSTLKDSIPEGHLERVAEVLRRGGIILSPTDTVWGLSCDATNADAVARLYGLKRRDPSKSMLILCSDLAMVERYVGAPGAEAAALLTASERPTTVIMPAQNQHNHLAPNLLASDGTIGVRLPRVDFFEALFALFPRPLVSTSANLSGMPTPMAFSDIDHSLVAAVDQVVSPTLAPTAGVAKPSRIVKLSPDGQINIIRD